MLKLPDKTLAELRQISAAGITHNNIQAQALAMREAEGALVADLGVDPSPSNIARLTKHLADAHALNQLASWIESRRIHTQQLTARRLQAALTKPLADHRAALTAQLAAARVADTDKAKIHGFPDGVESKATTALASELASVEAAINRLERGEVKTAAHFCAPLGITL